MTVFCKIMKKNKKIKIKNKIKKMENIMIFSI